MNVTWEHVWYAVIATICISVIVWVLWFGEDPPEAPMEDEE